MPILELSSDGEEMLVPCRDSYQRRYFLYVLGMELARVPERKLQPCVACGRLSEHRWCSRACLIAEDGLPYDEVQEIDEEE